MAVTDQPCENLSLIESLLQYRFATPNPLKARPGPEGCRTARLCNCVRAEIPPPLQFPPFPHKQPVPRLGPQRSKSAKRGEAVPLTARTGPYNLAFRKRGHGPLRGGGAAFDPGFGFFNFVSTGQPLLLPVNLLFVFYVYVCPLSTNSGGGRCPLSTNFWGGEVCPLSTWKNPSIRG